MTTTLQVDGMTCDGCVNNVTNLIKGMAGVTGVTVTLQPGRAVVEHTDTVAAEELIDIIEGAGYEARPA
jgi:copper chaperone CopZ